MNVLLNSTFSLVSLSRPDLMDNYLALVLCAFINNGLLEVGLVTVVIYMCIY